MDAEVEGLQVPFLFVAFCAEISKNAEGAEAHSAVQRVLLGGLRAFSGICLVSSSPGGYFLHPERPEVNEWSHAGRSLSVLPKASRGSATAFDTEGLTTVGGLVVGCLEAGPVELPSMSFAR